MDDTNTKTSDHGRIDDVNGVSSVEKICEPHIGITFESLDEAKQFYKDFSREKGFDFRICSTNLSKGKDDDKWALRVSSKGLKRKGYQPERFLICLKLMSIPSQIKIVGIILEICIEII
ncbi:hypothetical protein ACFE04_021383 [Oxalis oulophora]